ncbi:class I SAM-dependent methyltransferase [Endothiovibrio diazotrophicus]
MTLRNRLSADPRIKHNVVYQLLQPSLWQRLAVQAPSYLRSRLAGYPQTREALAASEWMRQWWYYSIELMEDCVTEGIYPAETPFLPRMLLANAELEGMECLDVGSMEGVIPTLMSRKGARRVVATDAIYHCYRKLLAVQHYHHVRFAFRQIGTLHHVARKLGADLGKGFDLINLSGLLYHVYSPFHVLAGVRPALREGGLMIVSTNIVEDPGCIMEFNAHGRFQEEANTFWYLSAPMLDYMLRYFCLEPIDWHYYRHPAETPRRTGGLSIVCRAVEDAGMARDDPWALASRDKSWEYITAMGPPALGRLPGSTIRYTAPQGPLPADWTDRLLERQVERAQGNAQSHTLRLTDDD